jgi:Protein of unknown function (DUF2721)
VTAAEIASTIQLVLAPVVMISACAITLNGLIGHYQAINDRVRAMMHERLDLLRGPVDADRFSRERLVEIDHQVPDLLRRHRLMRNAVVAIDSAIAVFVASMLAIAIETVSGSIAVGTVVLGLFMLGTLGLLIGVVLSALEIRSSHNGLDYEANRVLGLKRDP